MTNLELALQFTLKWEGGYVNDRRDPGGETKYGISKRAFPHMNIRTLTIDEAKEIYRAKYWGPINGNRLPLAIGMATFDFAVNSGVRRASKYLQWVLGVTQDGKIGNITVEAAKRANSHDVAESLIQRRLHFLMRLEGDAYDAGWINRCVDLAFAVAKS